MTRALIVVHHERADARDAALRAAEWLTSRGHTAWMTPEEASAVHLDGLAASDPPATADLVISLGGDGTMLRSVHLIGGASVPLLGVNLGRLGYLTEVEVDELVDALAKVEAGPERGAWHFEERMMLDVEAFDGSGTPLGTWRALNEAVVEKRASGQTVSLLLRIDGERFTSYAADGLIVSTPTGSTAYSLSARGPVVSPKHRALLVTPVAPHMLFDRSIVLDPTETVDIEVLGDREAAVAVDGRLVCELPPGAIVRCAPSAVTARFIRFRGRYYHQVLKAKFGLTDR